jgi:hypothetical protein
VHSKKTKIDRQETKNPRALEPSFLWRVICRLSLLALPPLLRVLLITDIRLVAP